MAKPQKTPKTDEQKAQEQETAKSVLKTASSVLSSPDNSQQKGQGALTQMLSEKSGLDLTWLPKFQVTVKGGPWAKPSAWKTKALKVIAKAAEPVPPDVLLDPGKYAPAVKATIAALKAAKTNLDQIKAKVGSDKKAKEVYNRLAARWYEATSGLLHEAIYVKDSKAVTSLGRARMGGINIHVLTMQGVRYTPQNLAFVAKGGLDYARALATDTERFNAGLSGGAVSKAVDSFVETTKEAASNPLLTLGFIGLVGYGGYRFWRARKRVARKA